MIMTLNKKRGELVDKPTTDQDIAAKWFPDSNREPNRPDRALRGRNMQLNRTGRPRRNRSGSRGRPTSNQSSTTSNGANLRQSSQTRSRSPAQPRRSPSTSSRGRGSSRRGPRGNRKPTLTPALELTEREKAIIKALRQ